MRALTDFNRGRVGLMGAMITLLTVGVAQSFTSVPMLFATPTYYAQFADEGGAQMRSSLIEGLRQHLQRTLGGFDVPARRRLSGIDESVVDLVRRSGLRRRK